MGSGQRTVNGKQLSSHSSTKFDRVNAALAVLVFLIALIVYMKTMAPTFSFWDCGEFVACSHILGIPHPPGSPLYIIWGRIFSIIPFFVDIAARINFFSVFSSAVAAAVGYLVVVRLIGYWFGDRKNPQNRLIAYIGGFTGALFMAFSNTNWSNSVEAEVYAAAILFMMVIYWLALKYLDCRESPPGSRLMLLAAYIAMLGVGIHLTLFIIIPVVGLYFVFKSESGTNEWAIVSLFFFLELFLALLISARPGEIPYHLPVLVILIIFLFHSVSMEKIARSTVITLILFMIAAWPSYFIIVGAISKSLTGAGLSSSLAVVGHLPLGWIGLVALVIWGIFCLVKYLSARDKAANIKLWLIPAIYALTPAVLYAIGRIFAHTGYMTFMIFTAIIIGLLALVLWRRVNWLILIALGSISLIIFGFWEFVIGLGVGIMIIIGTALFLKDGNWKTAMAIMLLAIIGYSIHVYIPVRSSRNPNIDENNPSRSFASVVNYLERKQYGSQSMTSRMFDRRAEWENQFGDHIRMGFWGFFKEQYGLTGPKFFVILILGLFGIWETIRRRPDLGLPFLVLFLICSAGFVLYMNFADGTRQNPVTGFNYLEVRDRDYFFTPAFILFGLAVGLGIAGFIDLVRDAVSQASAGIRKTAFGIASLLVLMPLIPLKHNYFINDRSRNYLPYDYANNYLKSCRENMIFITNGDNDTFPLWCIQEVYGIRSDVKVVNLSLANADWYTKQLRDQHGISIDLTDDQIESLRGYMISEGNPYRIQDQVVDYIITANNWKRPFGFAVTVPDNSRRFRGRSLNDHLILEGMVYRLTPTEGKDQIDYDFTQRMYEHEFEYRGIAEPSVYKDETSRRLSNNYAQGFIVLADSMKRADNYEGAVKHIRMGMEVLPESEDIYVYTAQMLGYMGRFDTLMTYISNCPLKDKRKLYYNGGLAAKMTGHTNEAIELMEQAYRLYPDYADIFRSLVRIYYQEKYYSRLRIIVTDWVARHPDDYESKELLRQIQNIDTDKDTVEGRH
nr:DUF2723 domain-containing protein [candidate division Zixibacteria bacterium]